MPKRTLEVTYNCQTFTRETARPYTHVVIAGPLSLEVWQGLRLGTMEEYAAQPEFRVVSWHTSEDKAQKEADSATWHRLMKVPYHEWAKVWPVDP